MFSILIYSLLCFVPSYAIQGDDMDDEEFASFVEFHDNVRTDFGPAAARGCIAGGVKDAHKGFQALCVGCATGAMAGVAVQMTFPTLPKREKDQ